MPQTSTEIIEQLEHDAKMNKLELPSLPDIITHIQQAINDPKMGANHVAKIIQMDPALCARLLSIANSPLYRASLELSDVKQAIQRLGLGVTRSIVTSLVVHNIFNVTSGKLHQRIRALWQHSCRVAAISQVMANITPGIQPDRAMLAGLLHDIGILPILVYADQFVEAELEPALLDEVIEQLRASLGQKVLEKWKLGDDLALVPAAVEDWKRDEQDKADYGDVVQIAHIHSQFGNDNSEVPPLSSLPAFNKLSLAEMGPYAGIELIEQARDEINATVRLLNG